MLGELLTLGLKVMVLGIGTTFAALLGLILAIEFINKIISQGAKNKNGKGLSEEEPSDTFAHVEGNTVQDNEDEELIAVITAAIAASLNRSTHEILVRSVRRVSYHSPAWNLASRSDQISTRL